MYQEDLAHIHHTAFHGPITTAIPPVLSLLQTTLPKNALILDIGCGSGLSTRALTDAGFQALGIDPSPALIALARQSAPNATFITASAYDTPFPPCHAILALNEPLTYHAPDTNAHALLQIFFQKAFSALAPGGHLIFDLILSGVQDLSSQGSKSTDTWTLIWRNTHDRPAHRLTRHIEIFRQLPSSDSYRRTLETHHVQLFTQSQILSCLSQAGFTNTTTQTSYDGITPLLPARMAFFANKNSASS
jgi:SAM-dependent methyltransferase